MITFALDNLTDNDALYHRYPKQDEPQDAYVELSLDGQVTANWNGEVGNAVPIDVWNGRRLRFSVSPYISGQALATFLQRDALELLTVIYEGHSERRNGQNTVATLTPEARVACLELKRKLEELCDNAANLIEVGG
jgi:hypothetical protein